MNGPNMLVLHHSGLDGLLGTNTLSYWAIHYLRRKLSVVNMTTGSVFTTLQFLHNLWAQYVRALHYGGLESLPGTHTLSYWAIS
jgi:hypothetical protein